MYSKSKSFKGTRFSKCLYVVKKDEKRLRDAASRNDCERLTELLEGGVNPNASDENGRTALHLASASGYSDIVKLLLNYKADCNAVDKLGNTPLHLAVCTTSTDTINLLLSAGCSALQVAYNGLTPLQLARRKCWYLHNYHSPDYSKIKTQISEIIMKLLLDNAPEEKKLADLLSSKLYISESSDGGTDLNSFLTLYILYYTTTV